MISPSLDQLKCHSTSVDTCYEVGTSMSVYELLFLPAGLKRVGAGLGVGERILQKGKNWLDFSLFLSTYPLMGFRLCSETPPYLCPCRTNIVILFFFQAATLYKQAVVLCWSCEQPWSN